MPLMILHPAYPGGAITTAVSWHLDLAPTVLALTGKPTSDVARAGAGLKGRDLSKVLSAPGLGTANTVPECPILEKREATLRSGL